VKVKNMNTELTTVSTINDNKRTAFTIGRGYTLIPYNTDSQAAYEKWSQPF